MSRLSPASRKQLHQRLTEALDEHPAGMPAGTVYEIRRAFGISQSTFYDHQRRVTDPRVRAGTGQLTVKQTVATRDGRWVPTDAMDPYLAITHATKLTKVHEALVKAFPGQVPCYPEFTKAVKNRMPQAKYAQLRKGRGKDTDTHRYEPRILTQTPHPGFRWCLDVKDLKAMATPDHIFRPAQARVINIIDDVSGRWLVSIPVLGTVGPEHITAAIAQAAWLAGGFPHEIHCDNGGESLNEDVLLFLVRFGSQLSTSTSYRSVQNGRAENVNGIVAKTSDTLPRSTTLPKDRNGKPILTTNQGFTTLKSLVCELEHAQAELNDSVLARHGQTRNDRWNAPDLNLLAVDDFDEVIGEYALVDPFPRNNGLKKVENRGLMLFDQRYFHPALFDSISHTFRLKYLPTLRSHVFVYAANGSFVCAAVRNEDMTAAQKRAVGEHHAQTDATADAALAAGAELAAAERGSTVAAPAGWTEPADDAPEPRGTFPEALGGPVDLRAHDTTSDPNVSSAVDTTKTGPAKTGAPRGATAPADGSAPAVPAAGPGRPAELPQTPPVATSGPTGLAVSSADDLLDDL